MQSSVVMMIRIVVTVWLSRRIGILLPFLQLSWPPQKLP